MHAFDVIWDDIRLVGVVWVAGKLPALVSLPLCPMLSIRPKEYFWKFSFVSRAQYLMHNTNIYLVYNYVTLI